MTCCAAAEDARAIEPVQIPTPLESSDALIEGIDGLARQLIEREGPPEAIGVGVPSQIDFATGRKTVSVPVGDHPQRVRLAKVPADWTGPSAN